MDHDHERPSGSGGWAIILMVIAIVCGLGAALMVRQLTQVEAMAREQAELARAEAMRAEAEALRARAGAQGDSSGHGQFGPGYAVWGKGLSMTLGWPNQPAGRDRPAWILLMRLPDKTGGTSFENEAKGDGKTWHATASATITFPDGRKFGLTYSETPDKVEFQADGQEYPADKGRVFLVDLRANPPTVVQVNDALEGIAAKPAKPEDPRPEIQAAVDKLKAKYATVREFLEE
jgi:type II secretory pathway pseudopilin PulG